MKNTTRYLESENKCTSSWVGGQSNEAKIKRKQFKQNMKKHKEDFEKMTSSILKKEPSECVAFWTAVTKFREGRIGIGLLLGRIFKSTRVCEYL